MKPTSFWTRIISSVTTECIEKSDVKMKKEQPFYWWIHIIFFFQKWMNDKETEKRITFWLHFLYYHEFCWYNIQLFRFLFSIFQKCRVCSNKCINYEAIRFRSAVYTFSCIWKKKEEEEDIMWSSYIRDLPDFFSSFIDWITPFSW